MENIMNYEVKDIKLAPGGHRKIQWVKNNITAGKGI